MRSTCPISLFFFFNDTATTEIYTLSLHDALPISNAPGASRTWLVARDPATGVPRAEVDLGDCGAGRDRKSTRLNSSHSQISYAVFCLKKKKKTHTSVSDPSLLQCQCTSTRGCVFR